MFQIVLIINQTYPKFFNNKIRDGQFSLYVIRLNFPLLQSNKFGVLTTSESSLELCHLDVTAIIDKVKQEMITILINIIVVSGYFKTNLFAILRK